MGWKFWKKQGKLDSSPERSEEQVGSEDRPGERLTIHKHASVPSGQAVPAPERQTVSSVPAVVAVEALRGTQEVSERQTIPALPAVGAPERPTIPALPAVGAPPQGASKEPERPTIPALPAVGMASSSAPERPTISAIAAVKPAQNQDLVEEALLFEAALKSEEASPSSEHATLMERAAVPSQAQTSDRSEPFEASSLVSPTSSDSPPARRSLATQPVMERPVFDHIAPELESLIAVPEQLSHPPAHRSLATQPAMARPVFNQAVSGLQRSSEVTRPRLQSPPELDVDASDVFGADEAEDELDSLGLEILVEIDDADFDEEDEVDLWSSQLLFGVKAEASSGLSGERAEVVDEQTPSASLESAQDVAVVHDIPAADSSVKRPRRSNAGGELVANFALVKGRSGSALTAVNVSSPRRRRRAYVSGEGASLTLGLTQASGVGLHRATSVGSRRCLEMYLAAHAALKHAPDDAAVQAKEKTTRVALESVALSLLGSLSRAPALIKSMDSMRYRGDIEPKHAYLLSLVDGETSLESLFDVLPISREAAAVELLLLSHRKILKW